MRLRWLGCIFRKEKCYEKIILVSAILLIPSLSSAAITTYTNKASYLAAISGYNVVTEGFEDSIWRTPASTITNNNLTWSASDIVTSGSGWARTGGYGAFDSFGDPDELSIASSTTIFGVGGWFKGYGDTANVFLDGANAAGMPLLSSFTFYGIIDTSGFNNITVKTTTGHWGVDDFTVATASAVPIPAAAFMFAPALLGFMGLRRKAKNSAT